MFKLSYLWTGLPGHPLHPPLTDATIGAYTVASVLAVVDYSGHQQDGGCARLVARAHRRPDLHRPDRAVRPCSTG